MSLSGDYVVVKLDDAGGTLRTFASADILGVDLPTTNDQIDVTGFGDEAHKSINGQVRAPVTIRGYLTTTANTGTHTVINGAFVAGAQVTLQVAVGDNAAPTTGAPEYSGEFIVASYTPVVKTGEAVRFLAMLNPATGSTPAWSTMA